MKLPIITVVTPSFNQGEYIEETICSVINQNYPKVEYIIIDGGSTDKTISILQKYNEDIDYWISEKDKGQTNAINKGFKIAKGEIISWINADDKLYDGALDKVAEYFILHSDVDLIHGLGTYFNNNGKYWNINKNYNYIEARYITHFAFDLQPSVFFRKRVFNKIGYLDEDFNFQFDTEFFVRCALNFNFEKLSNRLSFFREHYDRKSHYGYKKLKYPKELIKLYSRVLRSLDSCKIYGDIDKYINIAKNLNLYLKEDISYPVGKIFHKDIIIKSFFIYLKQCCIFFYSIMDYENTFSVLKLIRDKFPKLYYMDNDLYKIKSKLHIIKFIGIFPYGTGLWLRNRINYIRRIIQFK